MYLLSVAAPCLSAYAYMLESYARTDLDVNPWYTTATGLAGWVSGILALVCVFWHFSWVVAVVFLAASVVAAICCFRFDAAIARAEREYAQSEGKADGAPAQQHAAADADKPRR